MVVSTLPDSFLYLERMSLSRERADSTRDRRKLKTLKRRWGVWDINATHLVGESPIARSSQKLGFRYCPILGNRAAAPSGWVTRALEADGWDSVSKIVPKEYTELPKESTGQERFAL